MCIVHFMFLVANIIYLIKGVSMPMNAKYFLFSFLFTFCISCSTPNIFSWSILSFLNSLWTCMSVYNIFSRFPSYIFSYIFVSLSVYFVYPHFSPNYDLCSFDCHSFHISGDILSCTGRFIIYTSFFTYVIRRLFSYCFFTATTY